VRPSELVLPRERQCIAGRTRLHYLDWGTAGRPPLLLLHGGCLTAHTWDLVCLTLRDRHHCLALDQRGHGDSEWSPEGDYGPAAHRADIEAWIGELGCERPVLVGQSMGALNALEYARAHSPELGGIVLVDIGVRAHHSVGVARIREFTRGGPAEADSVDVFAARALAFNPRRDPRLLRRSLLHNLRTLPRGGFAWKYDRRFLAEGSGAFATLLDDLARAAAEVTCPVLVVRGAESDVVSETDGRELTALFPNARFVQVAGAGHTVQGDNPRDLSAALADFLSQ